MLSTARSRTERRRRDARLEAARYGELAEPTLDAEALLFRTGRNDRRLADVCRGLLLSAMAPPTILAAGHQTFDELIEPPMQADYAAAAPGAATETVLWTPNTTTQPHTAAPANYFTRVGQRWSIQAGGIMTVPATAGTTTITPRWGTSTAGVTLGASAAVAVGTGSQTNVPWVIQFFGSFRGPMASASSTFVAVGTYESNGVPRDLVFGGTTATIDVTTAQGIVFGVTNSVGSYSYTPKIIVPLVAG